MPSHGKVAAIIQKHKDKNPTDYCKVRGCLWHVKSSGRCLKKGHS